MFWYLGIYQLNCRGVLNLRFSRLGDSALSCYVQGVVDFRNRLPPTSSEEGKKGEGIMMKSRSKFGSTVLFNKFVMNPRSKLGSTVLFNKFEILLSLSEYHCQKKSKASIYFGQGTFSFLSLGENPRFYIHTHRAHAEWTYICPGARRCPKKERPTLLQSVAHIFLHY